MRARQRFDSSLIPREGRFALPGLFPDLNDEETLPPIGQKSPRVDLSIPGLGTVVEVKFMRQTTPFQNVIEEIAADASLYTTDHRWTSIIPFVWDDARRTEEHQKLVAGLKQLPGVIGAVVVSRPGKMDRSSKNSSSLHRRRHDKSRLLFDGCAADPVPQRRRACHPFSGPL